MRQTYRSISDVLNSPWAEKGPDAGAAASDRVLRSTKLEDSIYADLRSGDDALAQIEQEAEEKLHSFPALSRLLVHAGLWMGLTKAGKRIQIG